MTPRVPSRAAIRRGKNSGEAAIPPTPPPTSKRGIVIWEGITQTNSAIAAKTIPPPIQRSMTTRLLLYDLRDDGLQRLLVGAPLLRELVGRQVIDLLTHAGHEGLERGVVRDLLHRHAQLGQDRRGRAL